MIKIRYAELADGLHAQVERSGRQTIIHLAPQLSAQQRREVLGRLVRMSRRGHGPRLRPPGVALAVARDTARATIGNGLAAVRCHPAGALLLGTVLASAVVCYALFVSAGIRLIPHPGHPQPPGAAPPVGDNGVRLPRDRPSGQVPASSRGGTPGPGAGSPGASASSAPSSPAASPVPSPTWSGPGGELPAPEPGSSSSPSPTPTPTPGRGSARPSPADPGGLCVGAGTAGSCLPG